MFIASVFHIQAYLVLLRFMLLLFILLLFYKWKTKFSHQQKDYDLLYCDTCLFWWPGIWPALSPRFTCPKPRDTFFVFCLFVFLRFYLFSFRERGREGEKEKNIDIREIHRLVASCRPPTKGPGLQPRHVPWLGIEQVTFQFVGWHSIH